MRDFNPIKWIAGLGLGCLLPTFVIFVGCVIGWGVHIFHCIKTHDVWFLFIGAIAAPIGIVHGWGLIWHWW